MSGSPRRWARWGALGLLAAATAALATLAGLAGAAGLPRVVGWQPYLVLTGSMAPSLRAGDVVLIDRPPGPSPAGRIVLVADPGRPGGTYLHRVVGHDAAGRLVTRGDANRAADPPVPAGRLLGTARLVVPAIGRPALWLHRIGGGPWAAPLLLGALVLAALGAVARRQRIRRRRGGGLTTSTITGSIVVVLGLFGSVILGPSTVAAFSNTTASGPDTLRAGLWPFGGLQYWGSGGAGQGGVNTVSGQWAYTQESTASTNWSTVSAGQDFACGLRTTGTLWCWGRNSEGQLGINSTTDQTSPTQVTVGTTYTKVATGTAHACAIRSDGTVWCWGRNSDGQLGNSSTTQSNVPVQVGAGTLILTTSITAGGAHSCAIVTASTTLYCWGRHNEGAVGVGGTLNTKTTPQSVGTGYLDVSAGRDHTCAIKTGNTISCFGDNSLSQLGDGTSTQASTPVALSTTGTPNGGWSSIASGANHSCALKSAGTLWCWGDSVTGQLGSGLLDPRNYASQVGAATTWTAVRAGGDSTCGLQTTTLYCWGSNAHGQFGNGQADNRSTALSFSAATWQAIGVGPYAICLVSSAATHTLSCAGRNDFGALGSGSTSVDQATTATTVSPANWGALSAGNSSVCGIRTTTALYCWGANTYSTLGTGDSTPRMTPTQIGTAAWRSVSVGADHSCGIQSDARLWCWGNNAHGQLGDGTLTTHSSPTVVGTASWSSVSAGARHTCGIQTDGKLYCWGDNHVVELGTGTANVDINTPTVIQSTWTWLSISAGPISTCGVRSTGNLYCWGENSRGQLGDGTTTSRTAPTVVGAVTTWSSVSVGALFACALRTDRTVWCWGLNLDGQVGDGTTTLRTAPVQVTGVGATAAALSTGDAHACVVRPDGAVACWGDNSRGQLGNGTLTDSPSPVVLTAPDTATQVSAGGPTTFGVGDSYASAVQASGPSGFWRLDDLSGTTVAAQTGTPNGTYVNGPTLLQPGSQAGDPDTAVAFDGTNDYATFGDVYDFTGNAPFTVEFWVNPDVVPAAYPRLVAKEDFPTATDRRGWAVLLTASSSQILFSRCSSAGGQDDAYSALSLTTGTWNHVAVTYDGTSMRVYLNGAPGGATASSRSVINTTAPLRFGNLQSQDYFDGLLDEVAIYPTALSAATVLAHYKAARPT